MDHQRRPGKVSLEGIPVNVNKKTVVDYIKGATWTNLFLCLVSAVAGIIYVTCEPVFSFLYGLVLLVCPRKPRTAMNYCKSPETSYGVLREFRCPKSGRTYVTRFYDPERDSFDAVQVLSAGFSVDPFEQHLFPDIRLRHTYGPLWHANAVFSRTSDVIVQEWKEQEKLVGIIIISQRKGSFFDNWLDVTRMVIFCLRTWPHLSLENIQRIANMVLGIQERYSEVLDPYGSLGSATKFLAVEKGFQGNGIGSNLLDTVAQHLDAMQQYSYIESSHIDNIPLYQRFGYVLFEQYHPTADAPPQYLMLRQPKVCTPSESLNEAAQQNDLPPASTSQVRQRVVPTVENY